MFAGYAPGWFESSAMRPNGPTGRRCAARHSSTGHSRVKLAWIIFTPIGATGGDAITTLDLPSGAGAGLRHALQLTKYQACEAYLRKVLLARAAAVLSLDRNRLECIARFWFAEKRGGVFSNSTSA
ncbi:MAG: hypothetical protein K6T81_11075 [Alicyclobacillus macrosporangiidus]|uniref:hypothetical protein n=1 Tax=Alicyclobacillus macrosporangiidus TaxID=392015 RepID=UPI0026EBC04D|nr:hypothetical protein [Alicyclobacillus macrosporangiidus]MCL6599266.1 hypothetical protein [Alicyclobacillus macrosporangiidus]